MSDKITFATKVREEFEGPETMFASGDAEQDAAVCKQIREDSDNGNEWAWCMVEVIATCSECGDTASDYLGGCSYKDEADFKQPNSYYSGMCEEAAQRIKHYRGCTVEYTLPGRGR